jgi:hypothetical protein
MTSLRVWDLRIDALIPHRRWRDYALVLGWRRGLLLVSSGRILALRDAPLNRIVRITGRKQQKPSQALSRSPEKSVRPPSCN